MQPRADIGRQVATLAYGQQRSFVIGTANNWAMGFQTPYAISACIGAAVGWNFVSLP